MGLGAVWSGVYPYKERVAIVRDTLNLPEKIIPLCVIPVGHPAEDPAPANRFDPDKLHWNKWK